MNGAPRVVGVMVPFLLSAYSVFSLIYVIPPQVAQSLGVGGLAQ